MLITAQAVLLDPPTGVTLKETVSANISQDSSLNFDFGTIHFKFSVAPSVQIFGHMKSKSAGCCLAAKMFKTYSHS